MSKRIEELISVILLAIVVLTMGSCNQHGAVWNKLDAAAEPYEQ